MKDRKKIPKIEGRVSRQSPSKQAERIVARESQLCEECYLWLMEHMPKRFFEELDEKDISLITHSLMGFEMQDYFTLVHLPTHAFAICLDSDDADLRILSQYQDRAITDYRAFISNSPPPFKGVKTPLRVAAIYFTPAQSEKVLGEQEKKEIQMLVKARNPEMTDREFKQLLEGISARFLKTMTKERLTLALDMYFRAKTRDFCQYEVRLNKEWEKREAPSMQVILAWRNVPKHHFLYKLAKVVHRHRLIMRRVSATYIDPFSKSSTLIMSIGLHGSNGKAAWEEADIAEFLRELVTVKYFEGQEIFEKTFVDSGWVSGNLGNLLKSISLFIHQMLVHTDPYLYSLPNVEEGLCRHPEITVKFLQAFEQKFHPETHDFKVFEKSKNEYLALVDDLDTGNVANDTRRKNILKMGIFFVDSVLKTNFYRNNKTAFSFRLDPQILELLPYSRSEKFPELPFAIFFMKGLYYIGFHIRFKDLARGGLRTVLPQKMEQMLWERNNVFSECYNLAYTQQKKNKDIPEGGAKGVIFLEPYERLRDEASIYSDELKKMNLSEGEIRDLLKDYDDQQRLEYLYQSQRSYIESFVTLLNCNSDGTLRAKHVVDYWKKPEYIYLGPDENMHNSMIEWIAAYAKYYKYKPGNSFISSKPGAGINHKEFGVTSFGVNVYMYEVLKFIGIDPAKDPFTVKISGGPDGDVAGNQIHNLYRFFPKTAKLLALTDISGTIHDPEGLDLKAMVKLFEEGKSIRYYPAERLSDGGFLLDLSTKREQTAYAQQTLQLFKEKGRLVEKWLSGNEVHHLYRTNVHQTKTDIFIPAGGRPRTLNEYNYKEFLDETGKPSSHAIVEGANLYITPDARAALEKLGVIIIKDSSANKGGVICSSFEVLAGLTLSDEEFIAHKPQLVMEILETIGNRARDEAQLLLSTHAHTGRPLTEISELISLRINTFKYQILKDLESVKLASDLKKPLIRCILQYALPLLRKQYPKRMLKEIPDVHKKAIIATFLASRIVYKRGLDWAPTIGNVLPLLLKDKEILPS